MYYFWLRRRGLFIDILFEAVSALGTVGLSTGVTGHLDGTGKFLISLLMELEAVVLIGVSEET